MAWVCKRENKIYPLLLITQKNQQCCDMSIIASDNIVQPADLISYLEEAVDTDV